LTTNNGGCSNQDWVGDGYCDDEFNNAECNFDGADCCATNCKVITVTLENNVQITHGYLEGVYHNSSTVNGKAIWTSTSNAIWYYQEYDYWMIGFLDNLGTSYTGIDGGDGSQCPFDVPSENWYFYEPEYGWMRAGLNEINFYCMNGRTILFTITLA
jgi:hypothetical protein